LILPVILANVIVTEFVTSTIRGKII